MRKETYTVYLDPRLRIVARDERLNLSSLLERAIKEAIGYKNGDDLEAKRLELEHQRLQDAMKANQDALENLKKRGEPPIIPPKPQLTPEQITANREQEIARFFPAAVSRDLLSTARAKDKWIRSRLEFVGCRTPEEYHSIIVLEAARRKAKRPKIVVEAR
jgi:hypothetical protein